MAEHDEHIASMETDLKKMAGCRPGPLVKDIDFEPLSTDIGLIQP